MLREFTQILPRLRAGVLIHVHDVFTPRDYPEAWLRGQRKLWNEQYLLEAFLALNSQFGIVSAVNLLKHHHWERLTTACPVLGDNPTAEPGAFWMQRNDPS